MSELPSLTDAERARYEWQMWTPDVGEAGQQKMKAASVLGSRLGGVGGTVAYYLAAAGIGKLVLAHAGNVKPSDLNRQLLMTTDWRRKCHDNRAAGRHHRRCSTAVFRTVCDEPSGGRAGQCTDRRCHV